MRVKRTFKFHSVIKHLAPAILLLLASNVLTFIMCIVSEGTFLDPFLMPSLWAYVMNTLAVFFPMLILYYLFGKLWIAFLPTALIFSAFNYADYLKVQIRGETILPCDFTILSEAAGIVGELNFIWSVGIIGAAVAIAVVSLILFLIDKYFISKNHLKRSLKSGLVTAGVILLVYVLGTLGTFCSTAFLKSTNLTPYQWKQLNTRNNNGFFVNFMANIPYIMPEKPEGYNEDTAEKVFNTAKDKADSLDHTFTPGTEQKPNIIIIMSESFTDGDKFKFLNFDRTINPTLHNITETKTGGTHFTPQFGGGTSNVEFELLTGYSLQFLPASSTPYQQHIKETQHSYVSFLRDQLNYSTVAIHSYGARFWNRDDVYPLIGFDKFIAEEDFINPERKRTYVSDNATADMIISEYENNLSSGKPFFNFTVTMQNHGGYNGDDYPEGEIVYATNGGGLLRDTVFDQIRSYCTSLNYADQMLEKLTTYFSNTDRPTIIMFFGDHLGSFGKKDPSYYESGYTQNLYETNEGYYDLHTPPFVIWDNYTDISNSPDTSLSTYYLIPYLLDTYSLPKPLYFDYLTTQMSKVKGTANTYYLDENGEIRFTDEMTEEQKEALNIQQIIEYDALFGKKYISDKVWDLYNY